MLVRLIWFPITAFSAAAVYYVSSLYFVQAFNMGGKSSEILFWLAILASIILSDLLAAQRNGLMEIAMLAGALSGVLVGSATWALLALFGTFALVKSALVGALVFMISGNLLGMLAHIHLADVRFRSYTTFALPLVGIFGGYFVWYILAATKAQSGVIDSLRFWLMTNQTVLNQTVSISTMNGAFIFGFGLASGFLLFLIATFVVSAVYNRSGSGSALHNAAREGNTAKAESLIANGIDVNIQDNNGMTPLHVAAYAGHKSTVRFLIDSGANVDARSPLGCTPLHYASLEGHREIVELLISESAAIDAKNTIGNTALHCAAERGHRDIAMSLIVGGADVNAKGNYGETPLHRAAFDGHTDVVEVLINGGALVHSGDNNGRTPLYFARMKGHKATVLALERCDE